MRAQVFVWLPKDSCASPCGKGAYGHAAMMLPAQNAAHPSFYLSLGPCDQYSKKDHDVRDYSRDYKMTTVLIPLSAEQLEKMHTKKNLDYNQNYNQNQTLITYNNYQHPPSGYGPKKFRYWVNSLFNTHDNCTSVIIKFLSAADIPISISRGYVIPTFLFNTLNGGLGGYSVGVLSHLCNKCRDPNIAKKLGFIELSVTFAFVLLSISSYGVSILSYRKCPEIFRRPKCDYNPFFIFSLILCFISSLLTIATGYFHSKANKLFAFDKNEKIGLGVGLAIGFVFFITYHLLSCYKDSFNYLIRPSGLLNSLLKQGFQEENNAHATNAVPDNTPHEEVSDNERSHLLEFCQLRSSRQLI